MKKDELTRRLAKALLMKEGEGKVGSLNTLIRVRGYLSALTMDELFGIVTQNRLEV